MYQERCRDLFANEPKEGAKASANQGYLEVEETADDGWHASGLTFRSAPDAAALQEFYASALTNRATGRGLNSSTSLLNLSRFCH